MSNKLNRVQVEQLALRRISGESFVDIARSLGVSPSTASRVFRRTAAKFKACLGCGQGWPGPDGEPSRRDHESQCTLTYMKP